MVVDAAACVYVHVPWSCRPTYIVEPMHNLAQGGNWYSLAVSASDWPWVKRGLFQPLVIAH